MNKKIIVLSIFILLLPGMLVLIAGKRNEKGTYENLYTGEYRVVMGDTEFDMERYIIMVLAAYLPPETEPECLKAMSIVIRTTILKAMNWEHRIDANILPLEYLSYKEMADKWGEDNFVKYYRTFEEAVGETSGYVIMDRNADYIDALFHRISIGHTRDGSLLGEEYTYLKKKESAKDIESGEFQQITTYSDETVIDLLDDGSGQLKEQYAMSGLPLSYVMDVEKTDGYVENINMYGISIRAELFCKRLGLNSPSFVFEEYKGQTRFIVKGVGHGYGISIYGANELAKEGYKYKDIINYYYSDVIIKYIS
ncbi:MAG: SpoIID/LytB domain-containing protein [Lachnospiraceae bacterium]|nr:SpoIID/LytB domain-containing protein [Lachnospiraceae bacterium]